MDATYFLKERTKILRFFYDTSARPFLDIQRQIDEGLPPFDNPPYSEDPEPAFLSEWIDAGIGLSLLGLSGVSMLSDALKLYFQTLQGRVIGFKFGKDEAGILKRLPYEANLRSDRSKSASRRCEPYNRRERRIARGNKDRGPWRSGVR
jgi:hypothetical protein